MGKTVTASQMLSAGRKRPPTPAETGTERLVDQTSNGLGDRTTQPPDDQATKRSNAQTLKPLDAQATTRLNHQATTPLDDELPKQPNALATSTQDDQATKSLTHQALKHLDDQSSEQLDAMPTSTQDDKVTKRLVGHSSRPPGDGSSIPNTYQRVTVFLTPTQRQWMKLTARQLPDGLSGSDIVRLALSRLTDDVTGGLDLVATLTTRAHSDAEVFSGRRNRGLPPRTDASA